MKKIIAFIVILLTITNFQMVLADTGIVTATSLNVRQRPSTSSSILTSLPNNTKVNTLGTVNGFYKISYKGKTGYIASSYVKIASSQSTTQVQKIPVLMYHKIAALSSKTDGLIIGKTPFSQQMNYLKTHNYNTITLDQFYANLSKGTVLPKNPVLITFDDGYVSNYTLAYPILKANKQKAAVFVITNNIDKNKGSMTSKQLKEMDANGFRVENHTDNHEKLADYAYANQLAIITKSKTALEKLLGRKVMYLAYPCGSYNSNTIKASHVAGINLGITTDTGFTSKQDNPYGINRIFMGPLDTLTTLAHKLQYGN